MYRAFLNLPMIENIINFGLRKKIFSRAKKRMPLEDLEIAYLHGADLWIYLSLFSIRGCVEADLLYE